MQIPFVSHGGDGLPGFSVQTNAGQKTVGGAGGSAFSCPGYWGGYSGYGFGANGGGEANGHAARCAVAGGSLVTIEW